MSDCDEKVKQSNEKNINYVKNIGGDIKYIQPYDEEYPLILDIRFILNNTQINWYPKTDNDLYDDDEKSFDIHYVWNELENKSKKDVLDISGPIDYLQGCLDGYFKKDKFI